MSEWRLQPVTETAGVVLSQHCPEVMLWSCPVSQKAQTHPRPSPYTTQKANFFSCFIVRHMNKHIKQQGSSRALKIARKEEIPETLFSVRRHKSLDQECGKQVSVSRAEPQLLLSPGSPPPASNTQQVTRMSSLLAPLRGATEETESSIQCPSDPSPAALGPMPPYLAFTDTHPSSDPGQPTGAQSLLRRV